MNSGGKTPKSFVVLDNARLKEQRAVMEKIQAEGICPFCPENLERFHLQPILLEGEHWVVTYNQWPYDHTRLHMLLICRYHAQNLFDLKPGAFEEMGEMLKWASKEFDIESGAFAIRFGVAGPNGASVDHIHIHLIVGDGTEKVKFKVANKLP